MDHNERMQNKTKLGQVKMITILQTKFSKTIFLYENSYTLLQISLKFIPPWGPNKQYFTIYSDKGLAPNSRNVIIWSNAGYPR